MEKKRTVLLIEDSDDIRESIAEILGLADFNVLCADNGKSGVEMTLNHLPDIVLCDIMMPDLDGYGVLYLLKKNAQTANIPFIFLTARAERSDLRKGMDLGADDYLTKPFGDMELLNAIEGRLKKDLQQKKGRESIISMDSLLNEGHSAQLLKDLSESSRVRSYKKKQSIYCEGDTSSAVYLIKSGSIRTFMLYEDGREITIGLFGMGEFFGYETVLLNKVFADSAEALEPTDLYLISGDDFNALLSRDHSISRKFIELLSGKVKEKHDLLLKLAYNSVRKRVADALLELAEKFGGSVADSVSIQTSRENMASMAGTSNETISRTLTDFKDELLIEKSGSIIHILSIDKLKRIKQ